MSNDTQPDLRPTSTTFSAEHSGTPASEAVLEVLAGPTVVGTFHILTLTPEAVADGLPHRVAVAVQAVVDSREPGDDRTVHVLAGATLHPDAEHHLVLDVALMTLSSVLRGVLAFIDQGGPTPGTPHPWANGASGRYPTLPAVQTPLGLLHRLDVDAARTARTNEESA